MAVIFTRLGSPWNSPGVHAQKFFALGSPVGSCIRFLLVEGLEFFSVLVRRNGAKTLGLFDLSIICQIE
jgi:hypothetical protein